MIYILLLVDARGVPLSLIASGANVHDVKLLAPSFRSASGLQIGCNGRRPPSPVAGQPLQRRFKT